MAISSNSLKIQLLIGAIAAASISSTCLAGGDDMFWNNSSGGAFNDPLNWDPEIVPGVLDIAFYDSDEIYTVIFSQNITNVAAMLDGDITTFNLAGFTYTVGELFIADHLDEVGQLTIINGHLISNGEGLTRIGISAGSDGELIVTSTGTVSTFNDLIIGDAGIGALSIQPSGVVNSATAFIGDNANSEGTVFVTGSESQWNLSGNLTVAKNGIGQLNIQTGGSVSNSSAFIGDEIGANGSVSITGTNAQWILSDDLTIANNGIGQLNIEPGGSVSNATAFIGDEIGANGSVFITGPNAQWNLSGNLIIANNGMGELSIANGGSVTTQGQIKVGDLINASGSINVTGAGSNLTSNDGFSLGNNKDGMLSIANGATVEHHNGLTRIGNNLGSSGTVSVEGSGSSWICSTELFVGNFGFGSISIGNGAAAITSRVKLGDEIGATGITTISGKGSLWSDSVEIFVGNFGTGNATVSAGAAVSSVATTIGDDPGSNGTIIIQGAGSTWTTSSSFKNGDLGLGSLQVSDNGQAQVNSYSQSSDGTLDIEIGSAYVTSLNSNNNAQLAGSLNLSLAAGFNPSSGEQFTILSANSRNGTFAQISAPANLEVSYESNAVIVTVVGGPVCEVDLNGDGAVGTSDLLLLLGQWGTNPGGPPDFDGDGTVGTSDLLTLLANWGPCK